MSVGKKVRFEVFKRDKFACQYCGKRPPNVVLEVDHIEPRAQGGSDDYSNLITSCFDCNRGKGAASLEARECDNVAATQLETIAQLAAFNEMLLAATERSRDHLEQVKQYLLASFEWNDSMLDAADIASLKRFMRMLNISQLFEAIDAATHKRGAMTQWKYFCGVCWRVVRDTGAEQ